MNMIVKPQLIDPACSLVIHRLSKIFQPTEVIPKTAVVKNNEGTSKSQKLFLELGIIKQSNPGCFHLLPLGMKAMEKLVGIVDKEMSQIGAQKVYLPTIISSKLWEKSGRLNEADSELFKLKDRHDKKYLLSPTHEESIADLLSVTAPHSYKQFPLRLYQITSKFRDEMKPRFGIIRGRQFLMKDLYSFDITEKDAMETYEEMCDSYERIFNNIGVNFVKVLGSNGTMGGTLSHEFHYKANIGDDTLLLCNKCNYSANSEVLNKNNCPNCDNILDKSRGIEVGHTFFLGDKYSKILNATCLTKNGEKIPLQMGSYGIGMSRILAASTEVLSTDEELKWPDSLVPYNVIIIPPKKGSKEESLTDLSITLYTKLDSITHLKNNILLDDRSELTIGKRCLEAKRMGYPNIVVIGKKAFENPPLYEISSSVTKDILFLSECDLLEFIGKQNM